MSSTPDTPVLLPVTDASPDSIAIDTNRLTQTDGSTAGAGIARAAGIVSLGNVLSSVLGLVREVVKSHLFGASGRVSAYNVAATVPTMLYDLLVGGLVSSALVPTFSEVAARKDRAELWRLLSLLLSVGIVFLSSAVIALARFAPLFARLTA